MLPIYPLLDICFHIKVLHAYLVLHTEPLVQHMLHLGIYFLVFFVVYVQRRLIFSCGFLFIVTTRFDLTGHCHMYRLF
jgi:hypothetical protein